MLENLTDPLFEPSPHGGWSARVVTVPGAVVVTCREPDMVQPSGVLDAAGNFVHQAVLWRGRPLMVPPPPTEVSDHLAGRWLWGGVLLNHFGHFLTESTGRLWALDAVKDKLDGIVFIAKRAEEDAAILQNYHRVFFDLLGVNLPIRILTRPTRIDHLEVPGQGFGIGAIAQGTAPFRRFVQSRFARTVPPQGGENLYISRSELGALRGGVLQEQRLDRYLESSGYDIFHPQKHGLAEQVARYKAARRIIALDGSALHLVAMVARADQDIAIIKRRDSGATDSIVAHLSSFAGKAPLVLDVILQDWVRSDRQRADRFSFGELDFAALHQALARAGFVPDAPIWTAPGAAESGAAVRAIEAKLKRRKLTFQPVLRGETAAPPPRISPRREARLAARAAAKAARI